MQLWCMKDPDGELVVGTISDTKEDCIWSMFDLMPPDFRSTHWKNPKSTKRAYRRLGYRAVEVKVVETK